MRSDPKRLHRQRSQLDAKLSGLRLLAEDARQVPRRGWLKAVRESLGMSAAQLGARLAISAPSVLKFEANEVSRALTLASLERAARAMGCQLVYALVPDEPLEIQLDKQAERAARRKLERSEHSMLLEDQSVPSPLRELEVADLARTIKERLGPELWEVP